MIHWKVSALSLALGAAATVGFVWLSRSSRSRRRPSPPTPSEHQPTLTPEEVARTDALRDLQAEGDSLESVDVEQFDVRSLDGEPLAGDEPVAGDEHYDAIDPEEIGAEWLRRATQSTEPISSSNPFSDEGADVAAELPVGSVDSDGNTELHQPQRANEPGSDLSPNEAELAQRGTAETNPEDSNKPNE